MIRRLCLLAAFALGSIGFAGCRPADDGTPRVRIWHQKTGAERDFFNEAVARFNAAQDTLVIEPLYRETEELRNLFVVGSVGGQGPEIIFGPADNVGILALTETIMPLDRVLPDEYLAAFTDEGVVRWNGEPWMLADQLGNHLVFVYNEALMPEPPQTTDELIEMLQANTADTNGDGQPDRYGLTWNYREPFFFIPFLTGFGGWVMDDDGNPTLDNEATVQAIQFILDLRDKYEVIPRESDYDVAETLFKEQRAASIINGPWSWTGYGDSGVDYAIAPLPRVSATGEWAAPVVSAKGYSVNVNVPDEKLPAVRTVLEFLTGAGMQRDMAAALATIPTIRSVRESEAVANNPQLQASLRAVEKGRMMPIAPQMRQMWDGMRGPYQLVMNGSVTPEEGARLMQENVEKLIADTFM
jgi:maltose-binding protein MalE